jgi:adenylate kinase family enzyme
MTVRKIHIIGGSGSGKTYISQKISKDLHIERYDLDELYWDNSTDSYETKSDINKRNEKLMTILSKESWIIEGVYYSWLQDSFIKSDIIFILKPNVFKRDWRILKRFVKRKLGLLPSKRGSLKGLIDLIIWNHKYDKENLKEAEAMIDKYNSNKVIVTNNMDILNFVKNNL